ncbi:VOC family protein [Prolixibacteraceae bacterium JC049]|nr:VOC family protein [Prolixibacteraceae bacterium JC049]
MKNLIAHLGGVFIHSKNPKALAHWYQEHLGLDFEHAEEYGAYYISFHYQDEKGNKQYLAWSIMQAKSEVPLQKSFTVNYRVSSMDTVLAHLKSKDVAVKGPEKHEEGIFAWIKDPENNEIELWEAP